MSQITYRCYDCHLRMVGKAYDHVRPERPEPNPTQKPGNLEINMPSHRMLDEVSGIFKRVFSHAV